MASSQIAREVMETVLSEHEQNLLRMAGKGKSLESIAKIYRQYEGPNGVQDALDAIRAKVEDRVAQRVDRQAAVEDVRDLAPIGDKLLEAAGVDLTEAGDVSSASEMMGGAGAGGERGVSAVTPPIQSAPAPSAGSGNGFEGGAASPASARRASSTPEVEARDERAIELLGERRRTAKLLGVELGVPHHSVKTTLARLERNGVAARTDENAYDWPGAQQGRGHPSVVWRLVDEPAGCVPARELASGSRPAAKVVTRTAPRTAPARMSPTVECEHGAPRSLCAVCNADTGNGDGPGPSENGRTFPLVDMPSNGHAPAASERPSLNDALEQAVKLAGRIDHDALLAEIGYHRERLAALEALLGVVERADSLLG